MSLVMFFSLNPGYDSPLSTVSADVSLVCICNSNGEPQCGPSIVLINLEAYPGELFSLLVVVVGGDYGTTTGMFTHHS